MKPKRDRQDVVTNVLLGSAIVIGVLTVVFAVWHFFRTLN